MWSKSLRVSVVTPLPHCLQVDREGDDPVEGRHPEAATGAAGAREGTGRLCWTSKKSSSWRDRVLVLALLVLCVASPNLDFLLPPILSSSQSLVEWGRGGRREYGAVVGITFR